MTSQLIDDNPQMPFTHAAGLDSGPVPLDPYRSEAFFQLEKERVFKRAWLVAGRVEEIPNAGDYFIREMAVCDASPVIVRGKDGQVRAFHNTCSHRGSQVLWEKSGSASVFTCKYHNWTYGTDGRLIGVPDEKFFDIDKKKCGLSKIHLEVWEGWIFVNFEKTPSVTLSQFLGSFADHLKGLPYPFVDSAPIVVETVLNCNWKVVLDAFMESYHIPALHNRTLKYFWSKDNPLGRLLDAQFFGPHRTASMFADPEYAPEAHRAVEKLLTSPALSSGEFDDRNREDLARFAAHPSVNPTRSNSWSMDVNCFFPNFKIDTRAGGFWTHEFWPLGVNKTQYAIRLYPPVPTTAHQRMEGELLITQATEALLEDLSNVERTQRGLESGGKDAMNLQDNEVLIRHSVHHVMKWAAAETVEEALAD